MNASASCRFSVVIPLYNKALFVAKGIRSVLEQSHQNFELIVIDDGSTDGSADVVREFRDDRIRLVSQTNQGVSAARNRGIHEAKYDLIAFLDADDWWSVDYLLEMSRLVEAHPDLSLFCAPYAHVVGGRVKHVTNAVACESRHAIFDPLEASVRCGSFLLPFYPSSAVVRASILQKAGFFDPAIGYYEDYDLFIRIALHTRCGCVVGNPLVFYNKDVPAFQRATGRLPPIERSLVGHLDKLILLESLHSSLSEYIDTFLLFNLMAYVEEGYPARAVKPLLASVDPRRFTMLHKLYYSYSPLGRLSVRLNVLRRRLVGLSQGRI